MGKRLTGIEEKVDELTKYVSTIAWYYEETLDHLASIDLRLARIEERLGLPPHDDSGPAVGGPQ